MKFATAIIKSQKLRYANTRANLHKQVLRVILDMVDAFNNSDQPFDDLNKFCWGSLARASDSHILTYCISPWKWMASSQAFSQASCNSTSLMELVLFMFLIRLPPSMCEAVGSGDHKTATAMVRAADALWDACCIHDPLVAAATTQCSRGSAPAGGKRSNKRGGNDRSKSRPSFSQDFTIHIMACESTKTIMGQKPTTVLTRAPGWKTKAAPSLYQLGGNT